MWTIICHNSCNLKLKKQPMDKVGPFNSESDSTLLVQRLKKNTINFFFVFVSIEVITIEFFSRRIGPSCDQSLNLFYKN